LRERLVSEMTGYVSGGTLNYAYSLTHSLTHEAIPLPESPRGSNDAGGSGIAGSAQYRGHGGQEQREIYCPLLYNINEEAITAFIMETIL